ncbi:MAG: hypothetical protein A2902_05375 [Elusimicrobia bacterium RIFCSPLOWO2_01_FULL_64_13]|nr:MAG: hypothetical protein A2636_00970 [Elusimicrobia bacterium RIFCSPHIGHO2_01_FULL_64_10]OGR94552.1 MAG: hypothetical protein A2902_05375 [Elusimicrobia bacterium RIFCSPLOWO2_01_FULL_64_13]
MKRELLFLAAAWALCLAPASGGDPPRAASAPRRIIPLSPSVTEIVYALGLGDRIVGVTRYCEYPPEVSEKELVGGYYDPSYEAIVRLEPDLVIALPEQEAAAGHLSRLGLKVMRTDHRTIAGILASIRDIGAACGAAEEAERIASGLEDRIARVKERTARSRRPRVLISLGRMAAEGPVGRIFVPGRKSFYGEILEMAGGANAYDRADADFVTLSSEGILAVDPEVVLDMIPDMDERRLTRESVLAEWARLFHLGAGRNREIHVMGGTYILIPGPRFILLLEDMARRIHPEADWDT